MKKHLFLLCFIIIAPFIAADIITLKDEQVFEGDVKSFDSYYVIIELPNGVEASIPWEEVRQIKHTTTPGSWLEQEYMSKEEVEVKTLVAPLSPDTARLKALYPGFITRGAGHFYAKDSDTGMSLLSAGVLSVILMAINAPQLLAPETEQNSGTIAKAVFYTGAGVFLFSWLYDVVFSGFAVENFNRDNTFLIQQEGKNEAGTGE